MSSFVQPALSSFALVLVSEMGDKTQLLAFSLAARFKKPGWVLLGILIATLTNHFLASYFGSWISEHVPPRTMAAILAILFLVFGFWILKPDVSDEVEHRSNASALWTTAGLFFLAEFGDKTQLVTIALAAKFHSVLLVSLGTTLGMMVADGMAVLLGQHLTDRVPINWVRRFAAGFYFIFGMVSAFKALA